MKNKQGYSINISSKGVKPGWVLVTKDNKRVLAQAKTFKQLMRNIELKGNPEGSISIVPPANFKSYVG